MSNSFWDNRRVTPALERINNGHLGVYDAMQSVSAGFPEVEHDFNTLFGGIPPVAGFIKNLEIHDVGVQICTDPKGSYCPQFTLVYNQEIDIGIFTRVYKLKFVYIANTVTFQMIVA